jgi:succinoglycan biosynthesis transport protein ExoP
MVQQQRFSQRVSNRTKAKMTQDASSIVLPNELHAPGSVIHAMVRFLWLLRRRKSIVFTVIAVCGLLGVLYFATAPRVYRSNAQVVVRLSQPDATVTLGADRSTQDQMATFQRLFTSAIVLNGALDKMSQLPPEIELEDTREQAIDELRKIVVANTIRSTSIIEVACYSESSQAAAHAVTAVVAAYIEYIDRNHQSITAEVSRLLQSGREDLETRLTTNDRLLSQARKESADYGLDGNPGVVHPLIQNVITMNEKLIEARQRRVELQSSLSALRETVSRGGDLRQHVFALEPLVGRDLLLDAVGINPQDAVAVQEAQRELLTLQGELRSLSAHLGDKHFRIVALQEKIRGGQQFLASFEQHTQERLASMQDQRLGSMLITMLEEDLVRTSRFESELIREYELADRSAMELNDQLALVTELDRRGEFLRGNLESLMRKIEETDIHERNSDVRVTEITPPVVPEDPVRPVLARVLIMCLGMGVGLGALVVYVMDAIDDRFRSPEEIQEQLGVPVLAMARRHEVSDGNGVETLQVFRSPNAVESEAFRTLRTTLAFSGQECNCIVVTSSEPADGKTTVIANLGVSYAQAGKRTLLIDCDLRKPGLTRLFDLRGKEGVSEILRSDEEIAAACQQRLTATGQENLDVIGAGRRPADSAEMLERDRFSDLIAWAETAYDQILIDSPPVLAAADSAIVGRAADGVILVVQPQKNHRRLVLRAHEGLVTLGAHVLGTVVNAVDEDDGAGYYGYGGYGYGYGSGYGSGYGNDEAEEDADETHRLDRTSPPAVSAKDIDLYPRRAA